MQVYLHLVPNIIYKKELKFVNTFPFVLCCATTFLAAAAPLFIDGEEYLTVMANEMLTDLGCSVISESGAGEAIALFKLDPSRLDLVITDQTIPRITGEELVKEILATRMDMPVIMYTGYRRFVDGDRATAADIKAFAMKHLTKREIARTVRKVLEE